MKCALPSYSFSTNNTYADVASCTNETQISLCNEGAKRDSAVTPDQSNAKAHANQRMKKPCRSATTNSAKRNTMEMGMFFLSKPDVKAADVFPKVWLSRCVSTLHARVGSALGTMAISYTPGRSAT